ncbi:uncharacterized protein SAMN05660443_1673 [Marinospirillum celere]|uniref:YecA family protein n=1 Tax=Marinospirillum celere TaxID=1122252 RepID=A0A1I1GX25_9GAMM|nr:YecA family protein [Marinospirillum celere]SFC16036.1 uncharacterized protein SAMN05660443_1673 [Marinospirillum celere]
MQEDQQPPQSLLNDDQLEQLDGLLSQLNQDDEATNLFTSLGYVTAQAMNPQPENAAVWLDALLDNPEAATTAKQELLGLLQQAHRLAAQGFYQGAGIELPFIPEWQDETAEFITDWCAGFMQAVFEQEDVWFDDQEQALAELLLPIMALSGLFAEEADFAEMEEDPALLDAFARQLPELLLDIYCQLNAPEEKQPKSTGKPSSGKKNRRRR